MNRLGALLVVLTVTLAFPGSLRAQFNNAMVTHRPSGNVERVVAWVDAVLTHEPGLKDRAAALGVRWTAWDVEQLRPEIASLRAVIRDHRTKAFPMPADMSRGGRTDILYSGAERKALADAADRVRRAGLTDPDLVARAIVLHTDIAVLYGAAGAMIRHTDGRQIDIQDSADHWQMTRKLAEMVSSRAGRDEDLAAWYRATLAYMVFTDIGSLAHAEHAIDRFSMDAGVLFHAGCMREGQAGPRTQAFLATRRLTPGLRLRTGSRTDELSEALGLFRRAVERDPNHAEARLHYGRVLTQTGRASAAVPELQRALDGLTEPEQRYYGQMFLGAALEATDRRDAAHRAYESAATIFPRAQTPRLALSHLAWSSGATADGAVALEPLLDASEDANLGTDPWWRYPMAPGRHAEALLVEARQRLATPRPATR